jgi:flagellar basal-body rod protein FlgB
MTTKAARICLFWLNSAAFELSARLSRPQQPVSGPSQEKSTGNVKKNSSNLIVGIAIALTNLSKQGWQSILGWSGEVQVRLAGRNIIDSKRRSFNSGEKIMSMIDSIFGIHEKALGMRNERLAVLAKNIANAETPNFKARDFEFNDVLKRELGMGKLALTNEDHLSIGSANGNGSLTYEIPLNPSADGNTVEMSVQQAKFGRAAGEYQATLTILEGRISGIRKALKGE